MKTTKIHCTALFDGCHLPYHDAFEIGFPPEDLENLKIKITNLALEKIKVKCEEYFKVDYGQMISFEVYYYDEKGEILLFKKVKS